jgi:hypothetical protein
MLALFAVTAFAYGQPAGIWGPPLALAGACAIFCLVRLRPTQRVGGWAMARLADPAWQWGALLVASPIAALLWAFGVVEQVNVPHVVNPPLAAQVIRHLARTDLGRPVSLIEYGPDEARESARLDYLVHWSRSTVQGEQVIPVAPPDGRSNCHGWVFTGGQYLVPGSAIETILADNEYRQVKQPRAGDLAIYRTADGNVAHSGVVYAVTSDCVVLVESKWDFGARYVHPADVHDYSGSQCAFYHSPREGHRLRGI